MNRVEWSDELLVGVDLIDRHNKQLMELLVQARETLVEHPYHVSGCNLIDELIDYVFYHFASEEIWMSRRKYAGLSRHIQEHVRCTTYLVETNKRCRAGSMSCQEMLSEIYDLLVPHIVSFDSGYSEVQG